MALQGDGDGLGLDGEWGGETGCCESGIDVVWHTEVSKGGGRVVLGGCHVPFRVLEDPNETALAPLRALRDEIETCSVPDVTHYLSLLLT
jgi:hypothetical protein